MSPMTVQGIGEPKELFLAILCQLCLLLRPLIQHEVSKNIALALPEVDSLGSVQINEQVSSLPKKKNEHVSCKSRSLFWLFNTVSEL